MNAQRLCLSTYGRIDTFRVLDKDGFFLISWFGLVSQTVGAAEWDVPQEFMVRQKIPGGITKLDEEERRGRRRDRLASRGASGNSWWRTILRGYLYSWHLSPCKSLAGNQGCRPTGSFVSSPLVSSHLVSSLGLSRIVLHVAFLPSGFRAASVSSWWSLTRAIVTQGGGWIVLHVVPDSQLPASTARPPVVNHPLVAAKCGQIIHSRAVAALWHNVKFVTRFLSSINHVKLRVTARASNEIAFIVDPFLFRVFWET